MNITPYTDSNRSSLAERYRLEDSQVRELFGSHPAEGRAWENRATYLDETAGGRADLPRVAEAVRAYHRKLPSSAETEISLEKLEREGALVVVGGQQAGLFGGALLIYYKALSVIQAAREAERRLSRPVVPVFWIAGEDHDFEEANHVNVQSPGGEVRRVRIERPDGPRLAVSRTPLSAEQWSSALQELAAQLPDTEFKPQVLDRLQSHVADAPSLSLAFARLLADWFGKQGLLLLDADDPNLRALEGPMFRELILRSDELEASLKDGEGQVLSQGFRLQAETAPGSANLFLHHEQGRLLLHKDDGRFVDRRGVVSHSREEMLELTAHRPDLLSTNALTRPLMQDYLLPVLATVLGPAEIAYWAILGPAFREFGMEMPIVLPRQSYTYIEPAVASLLDKYSLTVRQAIEDWETLRAEWLGKQDEWNLEEQFRQVKEQFQALYEPVMKTVSGLQPGLAQLASGNRDRILEQIAYLESRSADAIAKRHESSLRQWDRIRQSLSPLAKPQERVYGTVHFWNRYGPGWLSLWHDVPFEAVGGHRLVGGWQKFN
ncbi:bacillithiol biosynthesis cysteine-adding enzyme BshC [Cohnella sp. SGD-V74]|uniref:bacillithiol biosynthesis cysteine-adding enzyme BshC n=1 Tax=unclassified Cohnella TaxID=2636738 RepID=UPI000D45E0E4|nr:MULTISPECIES: bacillithiol biosynthesis cysteine-adding enzyme BshC [unclassified Cohnella]PRX74691.1 bacillithiol biosynthesis cysteine-adding enzyme BshC [Cohnella sp. SGD-V74]